jgi:hypothetical protein
MTDRAVVDGNWKIQQLTRGVRRRSSALPDVADRQYVVPPAPPGSSFEDRGLPFDQIEDALEFSAAWRQAQRITHAPKAEFSRADP